MPFFFVFDLGGRRSGAENPYPSIDVSGSGHTGNSFDAVIHMQANPPHKQFLVGCRSLFMRLAGHLTTLRACDVYGRRKPDVLRPSIVGMRGCMVIRLRQCMIMSAAPPALLRVFKVNIRREFDVSEGSEGKKPVLLGNFTMMCISVFPPRISNIGIGVFRDPIRSGK